MDIKVRWTKRAWITLNEIYSYHAAISEQGARHLLKRLLNAAKKLSIFSTAGRIETDLKHPISPYRSIVADKRYKLIYRIENQGLEVIIHDVWPCRRDPERMSSSIKQDL
jgi:hypothetical protein